MKAQHGARAHTHSHMWLVGVLGVFAGLALLIYAPSLPAISRSLFLFAGFHFVGAVVLAASLYVTAGYRLLRRRGGQAKRFDFGWAPAWTFGPWIAALLCASLSIAVVITAPLWWALADALLLAAASFFVGGFFTRASGGYGSAVLPMVDLFDGPGGLALDGGCGAGRTSLALARAYRTIRIVALDRFDSDYIEAGGRSLLERNLALAGLTGRVEIRTGDLTTLPFSEATFDAAVSAHAVDHLGAAAQQGVSEFFRVLKPGGRFLLIVWAPGWAMFAIANVLSFFLRPRREWRRIAERVGFRIRDEGNFNGAWFAVLQKPEA